MNSDSRKMVALKKRKGSETIMFGKHGTFCQSPTEQSFVQFIHFIPLHWTSLQTNNTERGGGEGDDHQ